MRILARLLAGADRLSAPTAAHAHCDLPCGVYDPAQARIEAEAVKSIQQKFQESDDPIFQGRAERTESPRDGRRCASEPRGAGDQCARKEQDERGTDQAKPEPDALGRQQPCDAQQGQREKEDRCAASSATQRPHDRSIRRRAHAGRALSRPRHRSRAGACAR